MRIFILVLSSIAMLVLMSCSGQDQKQEEMVRQTAVQDEVKAGQAWNTVCPVQGHAVDSVTATVVYNGKTYGFCCEGCDKKFAENPENYAQNLSEDGTKFLEAGNEG